MSVAALTIGSDASCLDGGFGSDFACDVSQETMSDRVTRVFAKVIEEATESGFEFAGARCKCATIVLTGNIDLGVPR
jgi:hypothetical protein